jgi:hypothetical protein
VDVAERKDLVDMRLQASLGDEVEHGLEFRAIAERRAEHLQLSDEEAAQIG